MSAVGSEEQFLCSICLEVFSEPVSTPCGHNFCKRCISQTWDTSSRCLCPLCKEVFPTRPQLKKNTFISEMVSQWKLKKRKSKDELILFREVQCDLCSEPQLKAVKSCLVCLSSFCESHLQPHLTVFGLKAHHLMEPVDNLKDKMCLKHQRPLELFCGTDQSCVCTTCGLHEHKNHELLSLEEECERKRTSLSQSQGQSQNMVEQRRLKLQEIQRCLELSETENHRVKTTGIKAFTALMQTVKSHMDHFLEQLQEKQKNNQRQAKELIEQLKKEMCELEKSRTETQLSLSLSTDPFNFLEHCPALPPAAPKDWSSVNFKPQKCEGSVANALSELEKSLSQELGKVMKHELRRLQQFAVDVTLDPDTANPYLFLSDDLKLVCFDGEKRTLPDSPQRFDRSPSVLGKQSFFSDRFYFEVQVEGKTDWDLGVFQDSVNRKGEILYIPENGIWTIGLRDQEGYAANEDPAVPLSLQWDPVKVGVFVDYVARLVSFYNVDSAECLYSFTDCNFSGNLLPYFSPCLPHEEGINSAPLIITVVEPSSEETASEDPTTLTTLSPFSSTPLSPIPPSTTKSVERGQIDKNYKQVS